MAFKFGLKAKITVAVSLLVIFLVTTLASVTFSFFEKQLQVTIAQDQFNMVTGFASEIDNTLIAAQNQLIAVAHGIPPAVMKDSERAQVLIDSMIGLQQIFDYQISILTPEGKIFAETPLFPDRRGFDVSFRPYYQNTVATKAPVISDPYISSLASKHPIIRMTVPVFDKAGALIGIVMGAMDLMGKNILQDLSKISIGHAGYLYLTTGKSRMMIMHPDARRILEPVPLGTNLMYDKAVDGFEGSGETLNTNGIHMLVSFKHLKVNNWIVAANYPISEAHEKILELREKFILVAFIGTICFLLLVFFLIKYITYPLITFAQHIESLPGKAGSNKLIDIQTHDEIGTLSQSFNRMIIELDRQKDALQKSEERYRTIYDSANDAIFIQDIDTGSILDVNQKMCDMYGFSREEAKTIDVGVLSADEQPYTLQDAVGWISKAALGQPQLFNWKAKNKSGHLFWVEVKMGLVKIDGSDRLLVTVRDITNRKQAENALMDSEERFSKAFRSSPASMVITDIDSGLFIDANERWLQMTGYSRDEILGRTTFELEVWKDIEVRNDLAAQLYLYGTIKDFPCQIRTKSKDILDVIWSAEIISLSGTKAVLSLVYDNTEKNKAKKEQTKLQAQLLQSQKMESVGRLAGGVAHDYNNMLGVIIGHAELAMLKLTEEPQNIKSHLQEIINAAQHSSELTQQLLAFARLQTIAPKILDINKLVTNILKMIRVLVGENIELVWLPTAVSCSVKIDPVQFNQVLMNLCVNARDAISADGRISIETQRTIIDKTYCASNTFFVPGDYAVLIMSDNGSGMDKGTQSKVFEPFFTTKGIGKGTGLGLSTVYGIVKQNNGFINVYSEPGKGTTFKIYFPYSCGSASESTEDNFEIIPRGSGETILVVEDEIQLLDICTTVLTDLGYKVLASSKSTEAILLSKEHAGDIDLLMTDVVMPEMNGRELEQHILKNNPKIGCLFTSGYTTNVITKEGELDADVQFIQKPFTMKELALKIRESLKINETK
ncbi:MAG: PAS domain S-box protein [Desulfosporosinus sp.]|nr:PAS domain S-box protein [Desulfosporosinus sp.]